MQVNSFFKYSPWFIPMEESSSRQARKQFSIEQAFEMIRDDKQIFSVIFKIILEKDEHNIWLPKAKIHTLYSQITPGTDLEYWAEVLGAETNTCTMSQTHFYHIDVNFLARHRGRKSYNSTFGTQRFLADETGAARLVSSAVD